MRGKGTEIVHNIWAAGITPAYAGKRPRCAVISAFPRDHPRICGEKPTEDDAAALPLGSPPHMRGKVIVRAAGGPCPGITPAYAGKSQWAGGLVVSIGDHPRICGEKRGAPVSLIRSAGSPPHMRGKGSFFNVLNCVIRITPAYAGKSTKSRSVTRWRWDHPRICGEKHLWHEKDSLPPGSPPHMRGKAGRCRNGRYCAGITPAYAGKRQHLRRYPQGDRDHPRICGEKT